MLGILMTSDVRYTPLRTYSSQTKYHVSFNHNRILSFTGFNLLHFKTPESLSEHRTRVTWSLISRLRVRVDCKCEYSTEHRSMTNLNLSQASFGDDTSMNIIIGVHKNQVNVLQYENGELLPSNNIYIYIYIIYICCSMAVVLHFQNQHVCSQPKGWTSQLISYRRQSL